MSRCFGDSSLWRKRADKNIAKRTTPTLQLKLFSPIIHLELFPGIPANTHTHTNRGACTPFCEPTFWHVLVCSSLQWGARVFVSGQAEPSMKPASVKLQQRFCFWNTPHAETLLTRCALARTQHNMFGGTNNQRSHKAKQCLEWCMVRIFTCLTHIGSHPFFVVVVVIPTNFNHIRTSRNFRFVRRC